MYQRKVTCNIRLVHYIYNSYANYIKKEAKQIKLAKIFKNMQLQANIEEVLTFVVEVNNV